jgi:hypothetical protein
VSKSGAPASSARAPRQEFWIVIALCGIAAVRVFYGAATLPFFADTDENAHFDLVHKFARAHWPTASETLHDPEVVDVWIFDGSPEYLNRPGTLGVEGGYPPPVRDWMHTSATAQYIRMQRASPGRGRLPNHEAHEPPVYYALAAVWYEIGNAFGLSPAEGVYWVRFLNVPLYVTLVAMAYRFVRRYFDSTVALAVAALVAVFPNTVFFTISADVLSPLVTLAALFLSLCWFQSEQPRPWLAAGAGAVVAAAVLTKLTNVGVFVAVCLLIAVRGWRERRASQLVREAGPMLLAAVVPPLLWGLTNRVLLGEWTGTSAKIHAQTWTPKPLSQLLDHPLFTPSGLGAFLKTLCVSFFAGDNHWHAEPVHYVPSEVFFLTTAVIFPLAGLAALGMRAGKEPLAGLVVGLAALVVVTYVAELSVLSLRWDFGINPFPSRAFPFFAFGRLADGALVPFLLLYVCGLEAILGRRRVLLAAGVAATATMMVLMQWAFLAQARSSHFNWFHLP